MSGVPETSGTDHATVGGDSSKRLVSPYAARHGDSRAPLAEAMPVGRSFNSKSEWFNEVERKAAIVGYIVGPAIDIKEGADRLDNHQICGTSYAKAIRHNFLYHIALAFGGGGAWKSPTVALVREDREKRTVSIRLSRMSAHGTTMGDSELLELASEFSRKSRSTPHSVSGKDIYSIVFGLYRTRVEVTILQLQVFFRKHRDRFDRLVFSLFGLLDDHRQNRHQILEYYLEALYCSVSRLDSPFGNKPTDKSYSDDEMNAIVESAYQIYNFEGADMQTRLQSIVGISMAESLYSHIQTLVQPKECHNALAPYTQLCERFEHIELGYGMPLAQPDAGEIVSLTTSHDVSISSVEDRVEIPSSNERFDQELAQQPAQGATLANPMDYPVIVRNYLSVADKDLTPENLRPASKGQAFCLTLLVLNDHVPDPKSDLYYSFGFVACESEQAVRFLGGLYKKILTEAQDKLFIFEKLWYSLGTGKLSTFFDNIDQTILRKEVPILKGFLDKSPDRRPSVYRLIQFLRVEEGTSDDTDPIACGGRVLIRDYGFHLCKGRDEVAVLKEMYRRALKRVNALELHKACLEMRLRETVLATDTEVAGRYQRLLESQGPLPDLGYEKIVSDFRCRQGLFKKDKKRERTAGRMK